jgi:predicted membrane-bound mannosyltransferase/sugar lactone lactonase YvrE
MTTTTPDTFESPRYSGNVLNRVLGRSYALNWVAVVYIAIFALAIFTRFYMLGARTMSHDESLHVKFSYDLYTNGVFVHTPLMHGPVIFHMTALNYFLFGDSDFTARIYPAVLSVLLVMFPLLFRRWLGTWGAILASVMLLISPMMMYYGRYIREDTPSIFFTVIMVYCAMMYLDGPRHLRRKARWLYIFSGAMLLSLASKEVAFIYIAIFGSFLTIYWLVRMAQYFFKVPGKVVFYFLAVGILLGGVAALAMYVVLSIDPIDTAMTAGPGSVAYASFIKWTLAVVILVIAAVVGTLLWAFRKNWTRIPWLDVPLLVALAGMACVAFIFVEERSHVLKQDATKAAAPAVPGQAAAAASSLYTALPLYAFWGVCILLIVGLLYSYQAGWWRKLYRFAELDILIVMGTFILPWLTPLVMKMIGATPTDMVSIANAVQSAIPIKLDTTQYGVQIFLSAIPVIPAIAVAIVAGIVWSSKRWLISAAVFHILFVFFFTTVFTNIQGIGSGMIGSLGYWLEQQAVRRGNQPQYYYLLIIMPFYEFLPVIGGILSMIAGLVFFWNYRRDRLEAGDTFQDMEYPASIVLDDGEQPLVVEPPPDTLDEVPGKRKRVPVAPDPLKRPPFLLLVSWWAVFNLIAYTLAGEKMPWLATHLTTPLIFLTGWFFGMVFQKVDVVAFWRRNWMYLLFLPVLTVALFQIVNPFLFGPAPAGLTQQQLTRTYQWIGGIVIAAIMLYAIYRLIAQTGWAQFRYAVGIFAFLGLGFLTFRSAWMASFINYDEATEFLVYAHGGPANKSVAEQIEDWSIRTTGGYDMKFAYDFKISWPGAWYFRHFKPGVAKFLGENPSPRDMDDAMVVIVGDENRANVEAALEDRYYRFDYIRMWWPMQDYFNLTPERIINTFDLSPENTNAAQIREGMFDIWWSRNYATYGAATGKSFDITKWPVADRMYVFVRKDLAAKVWNLGTGQGTAAAAQTDVNLCNQNWQQLNADLVVGSQGNAQGQLSFPRQVAIGPDGKVYVAEEFNNRISVFNPDGTFSTSFGTEGSGTNDVAFTRPNGVAVGASGNIYIADTWNYRVMVLDKNGKYITSWGSKGEFGANAPVEPKDGFWGPRAITVDSQENVYVADTGNKRVRVYTKDGQHLRDIGSAGNGIGQLDEPSGLAVGQNGLLYIADTWNRRISVFHLDGTPASVFVDANNIPSNSFKVRGWYDDLGNRPYLALDNARNLLYVTDPDAGRVLVYNNNTGTCVGSFGQLNRDKQDTSQFASVGGISLDSAGNVFVADAGSGRILRFAQYPWPAAAPNNAQQGGQVVPPSGNGGSVESTLELVPLELTPETTDGALG